MQLYWKTRVVWFALEISGIKATLEDIESRIIEKSEYNADTAKMADSLTLPKDHQIENVL